MSSHGVPGKRPPEPAGHRLDGFQVRAPRPHETARLLEFFPGNRLGTRNVLCLGAFGHPGDVPLGAAVVRPSRMGDANVGHFLVFVRPECRRRKIGSTLLRHLYAMALSNQADWLILPELIHQDLPDNAFYRSCGLTPERAFATYGVPLDRLLAVCEPVVRRFERSNPHLADARVVPLGSVDPARAAEFFTANYPGYADQRLEQFRTGVYDMTVSGAAVWRDRIIGGTLCRTRPGERSSLLDLVLTDHEFRRHPLPVLLCAYGARRCLERRITHAVFEADDRYDHFAVGIARRCGTGPQWCRYRYSIAREQMHAHLANA